MFLAESFMLSMYENTILHARHDRNAYQGHLLFSANIRWFLTRFKIPGSRMW
jgi:hypothetical protein